MDENDQQRDEEVEAQGFKGFRREAEDIDAALEVEEQGRRWVREDDGSDHDDQGDVEGQGARVRF